MSAFFLADYLVGESIRVRGIARRDKQALSAATTEVNRQLRR
jgi:hypothetical protein